MRLLILALVLGWPVGPVLGRPVSAAVGWPVSAAFGRPDSAAVGRPVSAAFGRPDSAAFGWPVSRPTVVRRFDPPPQPWLAGHRGVDLAAGPGSMVLATGAGTVLHAGPVAGRGVVSVAHAGGLRTTYEPVTATVSVGDPIAAGTALGTLDAGHPGCPVAACLHWGLRRGDHYLDPLALLGLGRVRLLPTAQRWWPRSNSGRRSASRSYSSARL